METLTSSVPSAFDSSTAGGSPEDILRRAAAVPAHDAFPNVDTLLARFAGLESAHPSLVRSRRIATSRLGEAIRVYSIGTGSKNYLIVAGVHPNEPIGSWTAIHLAETLAQDAALLDSYDATWHIVPSIDPDGARLNETWYASPGDRAFYAQHLYRPAPAEQVEWAFPVAYKKWYFDDVLPETLGLMRLLEELEPQLYVSLHNSELGGAYYFLSEAVPELTGILHALPAQFGIPLDRGEPESGSLEVLAPAIYKNDTIDETYDYLESLGLDPVAQVHGASSSEYARRYGTLSLIAELPYWAHPAADDDRPSDESYADLLTRTGEQLRESGLALYDLLAEADPFLTLDTPFLRAARAFVSSTVGRGDAQLARADLPEAQRPATVAERFGAEDTVTMFQLRYGGMLLRAIDAEVSSGIATVELRRISVRLREVLDDWRRRAADAEAAEAEAIPIASLVGVQYGAILAAATHLERASGRP